MEFKGKELKEVPSEVWDKHILMRTKFGVSSSHRGIVFRAADLLCRDTGLFPPFGLCIARILAGENIEDIGEKPKEMEVIANFVKEHQNGFKEENLKTILKYATKESKKDVKGKEGVDSIKKSRSPKGRKSRGSKTGPKAKSGKASTESVEQVGKGS